jgi:hypothetical protein
MSISQRPVHRPSTMPPIAPIEPVDRNVRRSDDPSKSPSSPPNDPPPPTRPAARQPAAAPTPVRKPFYRREPWLAVLLVSAMIMVAVVFLPQETRRFGTYLGLGIGAIGVILLMMHKADPAEEARWREYRRHED